MVNLQQMNRRYFFLALVPIVLSVILALLPDKSNTINAERVAKHLKSGKYEGVSPDKLLLEAVNNDRIIQPDELAKVIMGQDPSYMIIDLRDAQQFAKFTLPGAVNVPANEILKDDNRAIFESDAYNYVLVSNGTVQSDKIWMLLRRAGYKNLKVLNGGINSFYQLYFNPPVPGELDPSEAFDNYSFRQAVGAFLGLSNSNEISGGEGNATQPASATDTNTAKPVAPAKVVVKPAGAKKGDEGC